jgi:hypothetical protein
MKVGLHKGVKTICEVLRILYDAAQEREDVAGMALIEQANDMAKRMQNKLREYKSEALDPIYLIIDDAGNRVWLNKGEFKAREERARLKHKFEKASRKQGTPANERITPEVLDT